MSSKKQKRSLGWAAFFIVLWFISVVAGALIATAYLSPTFVEKNPNFAGILQNSITLYVTVGVFVVSTFAIIICILQQRSFDKELAQGVVDFDSDDGAKAKRSRNDQNSPASQSGQKSQEPQKEQKNKSAKGKKSSNGPVEVIGDAEAQLDGSTTHNGMQIRYIPSQEVYEFVNMGSYQSLEDKFDQISKMDHTQFVIYVARLFSRKGYQVKLTPVINNHDIDLVVEKMGVTIAVGCLLTNKVLCSEDIVCVKQGKAYYNATNAMALTNMYFDRTALDYAKAEKISLVDRNILAEDFMS